MFRTLTALCARATTLALAAVVLTASLPRSAAAQFDVSEYAAWLGLVSTPVGAFVPSVLLPPSDGGDLPVAVHARYGHWQFTPDDDNTSNLGLSLQTVSETAALGVKLGRTLKKGCSSCGAWMVSAEAQGRLWADATGRLVVALNPEFGLQLKPNPGATSLMSAAVHVNISAPVPVAGVALVPFVAPGYGWGRMSFGGTSESGRRPMLGGGVVVRGEGTGLQGSLGFSKIFVDERPTVLGASIGFGP